MSGGLSSSIAGGNFWDGVRQGLITSGLNHWMHIMFDDRGEPKTKIPSPKEIKDAYPKNPHDQDFCSQAYNECAIRMSETFHDLGVDISVSSKYRKTHSHGIGTAVHQPSAKAFADWLWGDTELGKPYIMNGTNDFTIDDFKGKSGIIYFVHPEYGGTGPGHIDVIYNGEIGSGFYNNSKIWFWEFKNGAYVKNK